ncbi:MAG: hypothetical protein JSW27_19765, partial [Phycisphaerales bacterium]
MRESILRAVVATTPLFLILSASTTEAVERLGRGVVTRTTPEGHVYIGWRLLASDPPGRGFIVGRRATLDEPSRLLNVEPITDRCGFVDTTAEGKRWLYDVHHMGMDSTDAAALTWHDPNAASKDYRAIKLQGDYGANKVAIADLNGDGIYDYVIKQPAWSIDPGRQRRSRDTYKIEAYNGRTGSFMWRYDLGWNINMGIWFSPMTVYDLDGDGKAEVALKTGPPAATPEQAFISAGGFVLEGPEYCSILDGTTGREIVKIDWIARGDPKTWGDDKGNRVNRNQIGIAYLDGKRPSLVVLRGTYTKMYIDAYMYAERKLEKRWSWCGENETPPLRGQGGHSLHAFDIDGDGRDELIVGSAAIDDDGTCLWRMNMGHPDWCYLADVDPARPGLELVYGFETAQQRNGICLVDPRTGEILWGCDHPTTHIHDWGMVADIDASHPGMEIYGMERDGRTCWLYSATGELLARDEDLGRHGPRAFYWLDELIKVRVPFSYRPGTFPILQYKNQRVGQIEGQPLAIADCLGDWREEVITVTRGELRIYTTNIPATTRRVCLMQDHLYRMDV